MGTRAQFFIGNPVNVDNREWLGCVAWDGYPDGDCGNALLGATSPEDFIARVETIKAKRDDFTDPLTHSFPFAWRDDLFLTDCTYAYFDDAVYFTSFHGGWIRLQDFLRDQKVRDEYESDDDRLPRDIPAPNVDGPKGPDSIMIIGLIDP